MTLWHIRLPRVAVLAVVVITLGAAAGCSGTSSAASGPPPEKADITIGDFPTIDSAGLYIGEASQLQPGVLALLVSPDSSVASVSGLVGHSVSVTAPDDIATLLVDSLLKEDGVSAGEVTFDPGTELPDAAKLVSSGDVSAAPVPEPFASQGEEQYGLRELADLDQGATSDFPIQDYAVTQKWARQNPNTVAAFQRALDGGQEIADTDRSAVEAAVEKYLDVPPGTAALMSLPDFPTAVSTAQLQRVLDAMVEFGFLPASDQSFSMSAMTG
jgi:NitT/TauT family transport system substrate-binding protein